jgi:hypothetical protein
MARRGVSIGALPSRMRSKPSGLPGAVHAGDPASEVSDAGDHRRPGLVLVWPIVAARMEAETATMVHASYSATSQIGLHHGAFDRTCDRKQPPCGLL